jgi:hypothetical protein
VVDDTRQRFRRGIGERGKQRAQCDYQRRGAGKVRQGDSIRAGGARLAGGAPALPNSTTGARGGPAEAAFVTQVTDAGAHPE